MIYRFGPFELDLARMELRADRQPRPVEPQVFALLAFLVEHRERMVSKDEILEKVWEGRIVSDSALSSRVKSARRALGDDGKAQRFIRTVHGQGFRFVAEVHRERDAPDPASPPAVVERPSLAVLPFRFLGGTERYASIGEALPHELIIDLARLRWLFITARGSSFRLVDAGAAPAEAARLLGVRYCLTGTVEVNDRRLLVTTELFDTRSGAVVWAERFPGQVADVHEVRARIRATVLNALEVQIPLHEAGQAALRVTGDLDAWSAYHLGLKHMYRFNRRDNAAALELFGRATSLDPGFARAHAGLSFLHFQSAFMHQTEDVAGETALARRCAERGLELDPLDPFVNFTMGRSYWLEGDLEGGLAWLERATSLSPNYAQGIYARAWTETLAGQPAAGRVHADLAMRLSPIDPLYYGMLGTRAFSHVAEGQDAEAAMWAERAARSPGAHVLIAMIAAAAHALNGDDVQAERWAANVRERNARMGRDDFFRAFPIKPELMRSRISEALGRLGF